MKKKSGYGGLSEEENEFDVDEPEEIQNNASDDDWTPDRDNSSGRRTSNRLRNLPKSRAPIVDASSTDEESPDEGFGSKRKAPIKGRGRGRPSPKKTKLSNSTPTTPSIKSEKSVSSDSEPTSTTTVNLANCTPTVIKLNKDFTSGAFVILKTDAANMEQDPPLWKIDGKALLQKYVPFQQEGRTYYKNTSVYSGWTINNKDNYFPVSVIFKQQTRKEHIVEFHRDQIKLDELDEKEPDENEQDDKEPDENEQVEKERDENEQDENGPEEKEKESEHHEQEQTNEVSTEEND